MSSSSELNATSWESLPQTERLYRIRHSLAHVLAHAVQQLRPGTRLGFGPPIEDGLYYDFILPSPITEDDFPALESLMKKFIKENHRFLREDLEKADALSRIDAMGEPYKKEYAEELFEKNQLKHLSFFKTGPFVDMCEGPHVETSKQIPLDCFRLRAVSGAYWRGDSKKQMMTRIYAWAFLDKESLEKHIQAYELAQQRDHKKLGKELDIFVIDEDIGKGLPLWLPHGTVIRDELEKLMKELEFLYGYQRVATPHLAKTQLYYKTGHLPYYAPHMFPAMELKETIDDGASTTEGAPSTATTHIKESYSLRPMNCPHHHRVYDSRPRSYRDLPFRIAEYGQVYRFEESGALAGLLRVRGMCMNDAHIYCTPEQVEEEFYKVIDLHKKVYSILGLGDIKLRLSTWDPEDPKGREKFVDDPASWKKSEDILRKVLQELNLDFTEGKGEAAFYGPKIDFQLKAVTGREETASTCQLDFAVPPRLGLVYKGADNAEHHPYVIHRAPLGTHERFVAFLIEHFGGAFPLWLAPVQVVILPINEAFASYARQKAEDLRSHFIRVEVDSSHETFNKRLRHHLTQKVPVILIAGGREAEQNQFTVRRYGQQDQKTVSFDVLRSWLLQRIQGRILDSQTFPELP